MSEPLQSGEEEEIGRLGDLPNLPVSQSHLLPLISGAAVAVAAIWLYRRALTFAYFNDDPTGHFAWMEGQSLLQFFAGSADYGYYRPVVFVVLRLSELLFGNEAFPHNPAADHALLLLLHAANTGLVWWLARRVGGRDAFAWVVALAFAFLPFSYEAVAYVASLTHPLLLLWALLALLFYDRALGSDELGASSSQVTRRSSLVALVFLSLGLLTHENGLFIFPALVGLDWVTRPDATLRERSGRLWLFAVPPLLFAVLWLVIPKSSDQGLNDVAAVGRNLVPFLQTLVYPLLTLFRLDAGDVGLLALLAAVIVTLFGVLARQAGASRLWAFGLGWFGLSALPALLFLGPAYVYGSPRLSYLPSVGVALLWGIPILWLRNRLGNRVTFGKTSFYYAAVILYTLALIIPPLPFIRCQLDFYADTGRFAVGMAAAAAAAPAGRDVVFVNAPFFFSSTVGRPEGCLSPYPWTPTGGILIPPYAQPRDFVRFNGGPDRTVTGVTFPGYAPGWRTFGPEIDGDALRRHAADDATYVFDLMDGGFADLSGVWRPGDGAAATPLASFGDALALTEARLSESGDELQVALEWRVDEAQADPLAVFVHVYDAAGTLTAQSDGPPGGGLAPQDLWRPGDGLSDRRRLDLSALPPGPYTVAVGVYRTADGERLAAGAGGQPLADDRYPLDVIER